MEKRDPRTVVAIILGGGAGTRLFPLTKRRAKPAVGFLFQYLFPMKKNLSTLGTPLFFFIICHVFMLDVPMYRSPATYPEKEKYFLLQLLLQIQKSTKIVHFFCSFLVCL